MKNKIKSIVLIIIGLLFVTFTLITYNGYYQYAYELTFISNFLSGIGLIATGILLLLNKKQSNVLLLCCTLLLILVCLVSIFFNLNMKGWIICLHIIDPILMIVLYFIYSDMNEVNKINVLIIYIVPILYLIFVIVFGSITGNYVYPFLDYNSFGLFNTFLFLVGALMGIGIIGYGLYYLNRFIHKKLIKE